MENNEIKENDKKNKIIFIALILLVIILICVIAYLLLKDNKTTNNNNTGNNIINNGVVNNETNNEINNNITNNSKFIGKTIDELKTAYNLYKDGELPNKLVYSLTESETSDDYGILLFNKSDKKVTHIFMHAGSIDKKVINNNNYYIVNIDVRMGGYHPTVQYVLDSNYNTILDYNKVVNNFDQCDKDDSHLGIKGTLWNPEIDKNTFLFKALPSDSTNYYQFDLKGNFIKKINKSENNNNDNNNGQNNNSKFIGKTIDELKLTYSIYEYKETNDKLIYQLNTDMGDDGLLLFNKSNKKLTHIFKEIDEMDQLTINNKNYYILSFHANMGGTHPTVLYLLDSNYNTVLDYNKVIKYFDESDAKDSGMNALWYPEIINNSLLFKGLPYKSTNYYQFNFNGNYIKKISNVTEIIGNYYIKKDGNEYKIYDINQKYLNTFVTLKDDMYFMVEDYNYGRGFLDWKNDDEVVLKIYQGKVDSYTTPDIDNNSKCYQSIYNIKTNKVRSEYKICTSDDFTTAYGVNIIVTKEWKEYL